MLCLYIAKALALLSADGGSSVEGVRRNQVDVVSHENVGMKNVVCPLFRHYFVKKLFLDHGISREGVLLSETGGIFTATYGLFLLAD